MVRAKMMQALIVLGLALVTATGAVAAGTKTVVFPFELIDDSQEGETDGIRQDQTARLKLIDARLVEKLKADGRYEPVDLAPIAADIKKDAPIYKCNGCEEDLARKVGSKLAFVCNVQKVSNLILNLNIYVRDVEAGKTIKEMSVDLRGNTDESWTRGLAFLVKNRLFASETGTSEAGK